MHVEIGALESTVPSPGRVNQPPAILIKLTLDGEPLEVDIALAALDSLGYDRARSGAYRARTYSEITDDRAAVYINGRDAPTLYDLFTARGAPISVTKEDFCAEVEKMRQEGAAIQRQNTARRA